MSDTGPPGYVFAVGEAPYCCWEPDHVERSLSFLDGIDPDHFRAVAEMLADHLESDLALPASMVLRVSYHQAIEALMSFLGALSQAPVCPHAWIAQAKGDAIERVVAHIDRGAHILTQEGRQRVTFTDLADHVFQCVWAEEAGESSTASRFARFWSRLAKDFLDGDGRAEYNALKHGNRVSPGGFTLAVGAEGEYGVAPPPSAMRSYGGSRFGSSFLVVEPVNDNKRHLRAKETSLNWSAESLVRRLVLISMSIKNVIGALRCELGVDPATVRFVRPDDGDAFKDLWLPEPVMNFSIGPKIAVPARHELTKAELLRHLEARGDVHDGDRPSGRASPLDPSRLRRGSSS